MRVLAAVRPAPSVALRVSRGCREGKPSRLPTSGGRRYTGALRASGGVLPGAGLPVGVVLAEARPGRVFTGHCARPSSDGLAAFVVDALPGHWGQVRDCRWAG